MKVKIGDKFKLNRNSDKKNWSLGDIEHKYDLVYEYVGKKHHHTIKDNAG